MANVQRAYTPDNPLMQPVQYQGQEYFTSQYFHQNYLANSQASGKYRRHGDFLRVMRHIEAYALYVGQNDIREITWKDITANEDVGTPEWLSFKPLFQASGWNPITLLNATAQVALSHHLDDELSKQMSVAANTTVARQASRKPIDTLTRLEVIDRDVEAGFRLVARFGIAIEHIAQQEVVKLIRAEHGVDLRPLLKAAPAQDNLLPAAIMLEPTDLAKELGLPSGAALNKRLETLGWQVKKIGGGWEPTPAGKPQCAMHAWSSDYSTKSGHNWKWSLEAVRYALQQEDMDHG